MGKAAVTPARPTYYEVIFSGAPKRVRSFLAGLLIGAAHEGTVLYHYDTGICEEPLGEKLAEMVHLRRPDCHVVVDAKTHELLKSAAPRLEDQAGVSLTASRHIRSAKLPLKFEVYGRRYVQQIMSLLNDLPKGLRLVDFEKAEEVHPEAVGVEGYTPMHDYTCKGQGSIVGRVDLVIAARQDLQAHPLINLGRISLKLA